ncbi:MAG: signal peptide peptidase SppA [Proteobacteria bacterium]|nr:signal peptide peptidase SppA [Pseudomonadota bacterium]
MSKLGYRFALCVVLCACGAKEAEPGDRESPGDRASTAAEASNDPGTPSHSPVANQMGNMDFLGALLSRQLDEPGPYDEVRHSPGFDRGKDHFAVIELNGPIVELSSFSWMTGMGGLELRTVTDTLDKLAANPRIAGILLRAGDMAMNAATAQELRLAMERFKDGGKRKLYCHTEGVANFSYYVLAACDSIGLAPNGQIVVSGVTAALIHVKKMLDKLGVRADFLHIGAYKGAAEPLTRDRPSRQLTETIDAILDQGYETLVSGIATGRGMDRNIVVELVDRGLFSSADAVRAKLVDREAVYQEYRASALGLAQWTTVVPGGSGQPDIGQLMGFLGLVPRVRPGEPHVALVYAVGMVIDGKGGGLVGARQEIASRTLVAALRTLAADDKVKAIVLRIDSPGGSALASESIWHAVAEARATKPVVVSMAGVAASGGYYIACGADQIFALDNTLTGSIGVVGGKLALRGVLDEIGVGVFAMSRGKRAGIGSPFDLWTADERLAVKSIMESIYRAFVTRVASGRKKSQKTVEAVAQGRVWTGAEARRNGLVDRIGGLADAIAEARKLGNVAADVELEIYPPEPTLFDLVNSFVRSSQAMTLSAQAAHVLDDISQFLSHSERRAMTGLLDQIGLLSRTSVLTAAFFPVVF